MQRKGDRPDAMRLAHAEQTAGAVGLGMLTWFVPGAENYVGRINGATILAEFDEAKGSSAPALAKLKRIEFALRADALVADGGW